MRKACFTLIIFTTGLYTTKINAGNYGDMYGVHSRASGMGNAVTSFVDDSSAVFYNIAGLGRISRGERLYLRATDRHNLHQNTPLNRIRPREEEASLSDENVDPAGLNAGEPGSINGAIFGPVNRDQLRYLHELALHYSFARPELTTSAPLNQDIESIRDDHVGLGLALNLNTIFNLDRGFRFGLNLVAPANGNLLTVNDLNPTVHRYLNHGVSNERPIIMGGLGFEVWKDHLWAGVGFNMLLGGQGALLLKDVPISPDPVIPDQQIILELEPLVNPTYGLMFEYWRIMIGASYRRETYLSVDTLAARAQTTLLSIQLDFDLTMYDNFMPRTWMYGIGFRITDNLIFSVDMSRELWSAFRLSRTKKAYSEPLFLNDITIYKAGLEWNPGQWGFRIGYTKRPNPLGEMAGEANWIDFDRRIGTAGISYTFLPKGGRLQSPLTVDLVIEHQKLKSRHIWKYVATEQNPSYSTGGKVWHFGLSLTTHL